MTPRGHFPPILEESHFVPFFRKRRKGTYLIQKFAQMQKFVFQITFNSITDGEVPTKHHQYRFSSFELNRRRNPPSSMDETTASAADIETPPYYPVKMDGPQALKLYHNYNPRPIVPQPLFVVAHIYYIEEVRASDKKIGNSLAENFTVTEITRNTLANARKIRAHKRKAKGKEYTTPVAHLPSDLNEYIDQWYWLYTGRARMTPEHDFPVREGTVVVLFVPDEQPGQ